jgi:hypothetical protein
MTILFADFAFTFPRHRTYLSNDKRSGCAYISAETAYLFNFIVNCGRLQCAIIGTAIWLRLGRFGLESRLVKGIFRLCQASSTDVGPI